MVAESESLEPAARVYFRFPYAPAADMDCTIFLARRLLRAWPKQRTSSSLPGIQLGHLPLEKMWDDSALWLGRLLAGERFDALVVLAEDNESVARFSKVDWPDNKMPSQPATNADFPDITQ